MATSMLILFGISLACRARSLSCFLLRGADGQTGPESIQSGLCPGFGSLYGRELSGGPW